MINKDTFAAYHPAVNMLYFTAVIGFSMFFMHPVCLFLSFICASVYAVYLNGKKALLVGLLFLLPILIFTVLVNPLFNHQGATILTYLPDGNPVTLESLVYGFAAAIMLINVVTWFSCFNTVMTSDKFGYLLGRIIPALSLILSMSLRLVPRFIRQIKVVSNAQKCIGQDIACGSVFQRVKNGIRILSVMVTWTLENAIETADSMKSRGYGLPGRTAFSLFRFDRRDGLAAAYILSCIIIIITGAVLEVYRFRYFPTIMQVTGKYNGGWSAALFVVYFALFSFPLIINLKEDLIWKHIQSKT